MGKAERMALAGCSLTYRRSGGRGNSGKMEVEAGISLGTHRRLLICCVGEWPSGVGGRFGPSRKDLLSHAEDLGSC